MNIIKKLDDLIQQATHERSHYYTAGVLAEAKASLAESERALGEARSALRAMVRTHGMHGPCENNSCDSCELAYRNAQAIINKPERTEPRKSSPKQTRRVSDE